MTPPLLMLLLFLSFLGSGLRRMMSLPRYQPSACNAEARMPTIVASIFEIDGALPGSKVPALFLFVDQTGCSLILRHASKACGLIFIPQH
jgi:hypothetical protein